MKRFLTVLLVIAVMFTFSFGTSFAASYSLDDYSTALKAEKTNQLGYMATAKDQALKSLKTNADGFVLDSSDNPTDYTKAAYEKVIDQIIDGLSKEMDAKINVILNGHFDGDPTGTVSTFPATTAAPTNLVAGVCSSYTAGNVIDASQLLDDVLIVTDGAATPQKLVDLAQAPLTKTYVEGVVGAVKAEDYDNTVMAYKANSDGSFTKTTTGATVTNAEYVQAQLDAAKTAIATAAKATTAAGQISAYKAVLTTNNAAGNGYSNIAAVNTKVDDSIANNAEVKNVDQAIAAYQSDMTTTLGTVIPVAKTEESSYIDGSFAKGYNASALVDASTGIYNKFYTAKNGTKKATLFGVEVANIAAVTRAEGQAINDAAYATITGTTATLKGYAGTTVSKITGLDGYGVNASYSNADKKAAIDELKTIVSVDKAMEAIDKYAADLKGYTEYGVKLYDDAKVDAAVEAAKKAATANLGASTADTYMKNAAEALNPGTSDLEGLEAENFELQRFNAAKAAAKAKFIDKAVTVGAGKTAEEDLVFVKGTYADSEATAYGDIKAAVTGTNGTIDKAQSYEELDKAVADAKADLAKLMLAKDAADVVKAQEAYAGTITGGSEDNNGAIDAYAEQIKALADMTKYTGSQYADAVAAGKALIRDAKTVEAVKEAYAEAQKLVDGVKTDAELAAAKKAADDAISALPYTANLTAADEAQVMAAYEAAKAYGEMAGANAGDLNIAALNEKVGAILQIKADALEEEADALQKEIDALPSGDAGVIGYAALADKAQAIADAKAAIEDEVADLVEDAILPQTTPGTLDVEPTIGADTANIAADVEADDFYYAQIAACDILAVIANKDGATDEQKKAALDAYNALTDAQKYALDANTKEYMQAAVAQAKGFDAEAVKAALQDMSVVARSTKLSSGKIKVTVKADAQAIIDAGYTVTYKFFTSTKKSSGYKSKIEKATKSFTTSGVKGKTNYWKVTVKVSDAEGNLVAKTPLTQCRYACRTL